MSALERLSSLLRQQRSDADTAFRVETTLESVIKRLQAHTAGGTAPEAPLDLQQKAVQNFWETQRLDTLKDARLVSFALCLPSAQGGPCVMEDRQRFQAVLDSKTGVDQWRDKPRWYRRCYQGLVRSYFTYDPASQKTPLEGRQNWEELRSYLNERACDIAEKHINPDWVTTALENREVFGTDPCAKYAASMLNGDTATVDRLREQLGVIDASWFLRELVLAQVRTATGRNDSEFEALIPSLLDLLSNNRLLRDRGLILILDKYVSRDSPRLHPALRSVAVDWWGNPWLPSNQMRWGGVVPAARAMVADWLKQEFVEAFFTKLAEDGVGDRRRANFWLRYVKSMDNVQFALGTRALQSEDRDFAVLRKKMNGLYTELRGGGSANNAFIMTLGNLVAVEFGSSGNAFYGYDLRQGVPFDATQPLNVAVGSLNSLKQHHPLLRLRHQDDIHGFDRWEAMFGATLRQHFGIQPNISPEQGAAVPPRSLSPPTVSRPHTATDVPAAVGPFSVESFMHWAMAKGLQVDDKTHNNGNLWVRTGRQDSEVNRTLHSWGFTFKEPKGWWR